MSKEIRTRAPEGSSGGFTLIELMVAMLIGSFLVLGAISVFSQSRTNYRVSETVARLQENGRFALDLLEPEIRLVKNWGRNNEPALITVDPGLAVLCETGGDDVTAWAFDLTDGVAASDDNAVSPNPDVPCPVNSSIQDDTDVLVLRHASGQAAALTDGRIQLQSNRVSGMLFDNGAMPAGYLVSNSTTHDLVVEAYYIDSGSSLGADVPSLRRQALIDGGVIEDQEIIPGVENLQVQFGVDTDGDGNVDRYVDSDHDILTPGSGSYVSDAEIVAVRFWLLIRADRPENGHTDTGPYAPIDADLADLTPNDSFRRVVVSKTVYLRNARG